MRQNANMYRGAVILVAALANLAIFAWPPFANTASAQMGCQNCQQVLKNVNVAGAMNKAGTAATCIHWSPSNCFEVNMYTIGGDGNTFNQNIGNTTCYNENLPCWVWCNCPDTIVEVQVSGGVGNQVGVFPRDYCNYNSHS